MKSRTSAAGLAVLTLGTLVYPLDSSVTVAFPYITEHFAQPMSATRLLVISFVRTSASILLVCGRIGDLWGYRRVLQAGLALSLAAFVIIGLAPSYGILLMGRIVQGVGAALIASCGPALSMGLFGEDARGRAIGFYTMIVVLSMAAGPLLGGWLVENWGWSAVFWFRAPLAFLALIMSPQLSAPDFREQSAFDYRGAGLMSTTIILFFVSLNLAWGHGGLAAGVGLVALISATLLIRQQRLSPAPIIDLAYFRALDFSLINISSLLVNFTTFAIMLLVPFYLRRMSDFSVLEAGLALAAHPAGTALASYGVGRLLGRPSASIIAPRLAYGGILMAAVGLWLIGGWGAGLGLAAISVNLLFTGLGLGLFQASYMFIITGAIPPEHRGVAGSLATNTRTFGIMIAATSVFEAFRALEASNSFMTSFQTLFQSAAAVPACVIVMAGLIRLGHGR